VLLKEPNLAGSNFRHQITGFATCLRLIVHEPVTLRIDSLLTSSPSEGRPHRMEENMEEDRAPEQLAPAASESATSKPLPWRYWEVEIGVFGSRWRAPALSLDDPPVPRFMVINRTTQIGRLGENYLGPDISLLDEKVSRQTAELRFDAAGELEIHVFAPRNKPSISGTILFPEAVRKIEHGDHLHLGECSVLIFRVRFKNRALDYIARALATMKGRQFASKW
jgi:hypothetical protein